MRVCAHIYLYYICVYIAIKCITKNVREQENLIIRMICGIIINPLTNKCHITLFHPRTIMISIRNSSNNFSAVSNYHYYSSLDFD